MSEKRIRIYELFDGPRGLSAQTRDYHGILYMVSAVSIRQAYYLAGHMQWASDLDKPIGIVEHYTRGGADEGWWQLWCGCRIHHGLGIRHGTPKTRISAAMRAHMQTRHGADQA